MGAPRRTSVRARPEKRQYGSREAAPRAIRRARRSTPPPTEVETRSRARPHIVLGAILNILFRPHYKFSVARPRMTPDASQESRSAPEREERHRLPDDERPDESFFMGDEEWGPDTPIRAGQLVNLLRAAAGAVGTRVEEIERATRVAEFMAEFETALDAVPFEEVRDLEVSAEAAEAGTEIEQLIRALGATASVIGKQRRASKAIRATLDDAARRLEEALRRWIGSRKARLGPRQLGYLNVLSAFEERLETRRLVDEVHDARDEAVRVLSDTKRAAGATGSTSLAVHFASYATHERRSADRLRAAAVGVLLAITLIAATLTWVDPEDASARDVARLSLTIPLAVLAAYLGREASRHRSASRWARELEVQLLTVDAYTEPLSNELRDNIRAELGRRVFATSTGEIAGVASMAPSAVGEAAGLVERIGNLARSSPGRQSA